MTQTPHNPASTPAAAPLAGPSGAAIPPGRIDLHSHLLPAIDDGCASLEESLECVRRLIAAGFAGSVCTPHIWPDMFPQNSVEHIAVWTQMIQAEIDKAGLRYRLWPGGEVRLFKGMETYFTSHPLPTLAGTRCVLVDYWEHSLHRWFSTTLEWLVGKGYRVILAHPERMHCVADLVKKLPELRRMGVQLQGNFQCMTGTEGYQADRYVRNWLGDGSYQYLALDMHGPEGLDGRLDGLQLVEAEFGPALLEELVVHAPRRLLAGGAAR